MNNPRLIERWLLGGGRPEDSASLRERARHDEALRGLYDDYFSILRALERGEGLGDERDQSPAATPESSEDPSAEELLWLSDDFFDSWQAPAPSAVERWLARLKQLQVFTPVAVALAAIAGVWIGLGRERAADDGARLPSHTTGLVARGTGRDAELELEIFCGQPPASVNDGRCTLNDELTFAARATRRGDTRTLSVFGIGQDGAVKYYAPSPVEAEGIAIIAERWQTADFSVDLAVNHQQGALRVFAVLAPRAATLAEIDAWAAAISRQPARFDTDSSWVAALTELDSLLTDDLCPDADACDAVQTQLMLDSSGDHP